MDKPAVFLNDISLLQDMAHHAMCSPYSRDWLFRWGINDRTIGDDERKKLYRMYHGPKHYTMEQTRSRYPISLKQQQFFLGRWRNFSTCIHEVYVLAMKRTSASQRFLTKIHAPKVVVGHTSEIGQAASFVAQFAIKQVLSKAVPGFSETSRILGTGRKALGMDQTNIYSNANKLWALMNYFSDSPEVKDHWGLWQRNKSQIYMVFHVVTPLHELRDDKGVDYDGLWPAKSFIHLQACRPFDKDLARLLKQMPLQAEQLSKGELLRRNRLVFNRGVNFTLDNTKQQGEKDKFSRPEYGADIKQYSYESFIQSPTVLETIAPELLRVKEE